MKTFTVNRENEGKRLDKFLTETLVDTTRSQIKKMIKNQLISVNEKFPTVHQFLKEGDSVRISEPEIVSQASVPVIRMLAKGSGYVVINKPAGVMTHGTPGRHGDPTVTAWIKAELPGALALGDPERPGIVHRLDKDTSGVMIVATSQPMYDSLKAQFKNRQIHKEYIALVHGHLPKKNMKVEKPIGRSKNGTGMAARVKALSDKDREATTEFEVIKSYSKFDLVKARPITGRTHQIRVHLKSIGNPVVGDKLYKIRGQKEAAELNRLFLHARSVSFSDLDGNPQTVNSTLPKELSEFLNTIE